MPQTLRESPCCPASSQKFSSGYKRHAFCFHSAGCVSAALTQEVTIDTESQTLSHPTKFQQDIHMLHMHIKV